MYAHENGCEWDEETGNTAIIHMSVKCLKYTISNGCPLDETIFIKLSSKNNFSALKCVNKDFQINLIFQNILL